MSAPAPARRRRPGHRGTSNTNDRGSSYDRRRRRAWLLRTFGDGTTAPCFRCSVLLTEETITVDRIVPGRDGGTYAHGNIRPACARDNSELGGALAAGRPTVFGVDPGPIPGVAIVRPDGLVELVQVTAGVLPVVLRALLLDCPLGAPTAESVVESPHAILAVEKYVIGRRSTRVKAAGANAATSRMVGAVEALGTELGVPVMVRPAAAVKPWALAGEPSRVERAGFVVEGMKHARSAGWHALFAAVADAGHPDPLSKRGRSS